jgi:predicted GNAT family acetyltransferase/glutaredoxin
LLTLYQAEWCPFSSAVREVLTELGIDVSLRQVEPRAEEREGLRALANTDQIPVLEDEDGELYRGTREIFRYLREREPWRFAAEHRTRFLEHRDARVSDATGHMVEYFRGTGELEAAEEDAGPDDAVVVDVREKHRYELRHDGRLIGLLAYRRREKSIAFTHTEVSEECEGRGFGTRLVVHALDEAHRAGLEVVALCPFVAHVAARRAA